MSVRSIVVVVWCLMVVPASAVAQTAVSGAIAGVVRDTSGGVLPGVTVEATSPALIENARTVVTDGQGLYRIVDLRPGSYTVIFSLPGFSTLRREGIELETAFTATVNVELAVGGLDETVTVSGVAPTVDIHNIVQRQVFSRAVVDTLPVGTNTGMYATLIPAASTGVSPAGAIGGADVGGTQSERMTAAFSVHGATEDMQMTQDGLPFTSGTGGATTWSMNRVGSQEVSVQVGGISAEGESGGVHMNIVPREGGNNFSGTFVLDGTTGALQSNNIGDDLRARGVTGSPTVKQVYNVGGGFGGPIKQNKLWFFTAHRKWATSQWMPGRYYSATQGTPFYTPDLSRPASSLDYYRSHNLRLTAQVAAKHKISFAFDRQDNCQCVVRLLTELRAPEAAPDHVYVHNFPQVTWSYPATNRLLFDAGASVLRSPRKNRLAAGATANDISITELSTGFVYNARGGPVDSNGGSTGFADSGTSTQRFAVAYVTGTHNVKVGLLNQQHPSESFYELNQAVSYRFQNGRPLSLVEWVSPRVSEGQAYNFAMYAQDQWTLRRVTLNLGVRYNQFGASVPETVVPAGRFSPAVTYPEVLDASAFKDLSPRVGAAYDLFGDGKTALKGFLGQYVIRRAAPPSSANAANARVLSATRTWSDANGDFIPQESELGPLSDVNFGNATVSSTHADRDVNYGWGKRDYTWQGSVSIEHELRSGVGVNVGYFRTWYGNLTLSDNLLVTPADFDQFCITTPVDPRLPGSGNQICGLYDVKPAKFAQVNTLQSLAGDRRTRVFNGVDVIMRARFRERGLLEGGVAMGKTVIDDCGAAVDSPQALRFCRQIKGWADDMRVKIHGAYPLPWDFMASANFQSVPGIPITATYVATGAEIAQSLGRNPSAGARATSTIELIAPNTLFEERTPLLDLRFSRLFRMGRGKLTGNFDISNVFNASTLQGININYGPQWLNGLNAMGGRLLKFGMEFDF